MCVHACVCKLLKVRGKKKKNMPLMGLERGVIDSHGEGNGNSLQCSCLENPRDSRAWWADVYGVAQSRT